MIPLSVPVISGNEWKYIKECLDTGWVSSVGKYVEHFEDRLKEYVGSRYAVATVSGTAALHLSLLASGVDKDDEVIVPALTFIAPVNAVKYCGAYPVFMDCVNDTLCIDVQKVADFIDKECEQRLDGYTYNKKTGRRVKAVIPVHIFGHPTDMDSLSMVCQKQNIDIIEDATESLGSVYRGKKTGSIGRVGCFSFNGNKIITTGGGGMAVTDDESVAKRIRHLSTQARSDPMEYFHDEIGYNYRLSNLSAAMGAAQMERIEEYVEIKRKNAMLYRELVTGLPEVELLWERDDVRNSFWFYTIRIDRRRKQGLIEYLNSRDIQARPLWRLINTLPMYKDCQAFEITSAYRAYNECINIPCSVNLTDKDIRFVVQAIKDFLDLG